MKLLKALEHKFLRDAATLQVGAALNALGNFVSAALLAHILGARVQGEFYVAISLYSFLWFLVNQGLQQATVSQVAAAHARGLSDKVDAWLAYLLKANLVFGSALVVLGFLVLPWASTHVLDSDRRLGEWAAWLAISPLVEAPRVVALAAMQGLRRMRPLAQSENGQEVVRVFLVVAGALITRSAVGPIVGTILASAAGSLIAMELYRRDRRSAGSPLPPTREILQHFRDVPLRHGVPLGVKIGIVRNLNALCMQILPSLFLQRFGSSEWVAYLRIAQRLMNVPLMFMQGISRTTLPMFSAIAGTKDLHRLKRAFFKASALSGLMISAGVLLVLPFLPWILKSFFPRNYVEPVWTTCLILVPGFIVMSFSIANDTFYLVTNTLKVAVVISVIGMLVSTTLVGVLAYLWPTTGVAWGLTINMASSLLHFGYAAWYLRRHAPGSAPVSASP